MAILDKGVYVLKHTLDFHWVTSNKSENINFHIFDNDNVRKNYTSFNVYPLTEMVEYDAFTYYDYGWLEDYANTIYIDEDTDLLDSEMYNFIFNNSEKINYILSFDTNGGNTIPSRQQVYEILSLPTPVKEGNQFLGWYYDNETFLQQVQIGDYLTEDTIIYAKWLPVFTVTYNSLGGTPVSTLTGQTEITYLPTIVKTGNDFLGWYYEISYTNQATLGDILTENVTLYAKWKYKGDFELTFYNNTAEPKQVDKTNYLLNATKGEGYIRELTSVVNMTVTVEYSGTFNFNYCYISYFNRYFFIEDIQSYRMGLWKLVLKCDVLMTYKDYIKTQQAYIVRQEFNYDDDLDDDELQIETEPIIQVKELLGDRGSPFNNTGSSNASYVLVVAREEI